MSREGRPHPYHRGLSRETVLAAALAVLDVGGAGALTMRRVAAELGVEAASLYAHVRNKDDMLDGALDLVLDSIEVPLRAASPREWLVAGYSAYRAALVPHPGAVAATTSRVRFSTAQFRLLERVIETLESTGLSTDDAVLGHITLVSFTLGFVVGEVGRPSSVPRELLATSPVMQRSFPVVGRHSVDERFRHGLEMILDGILGPAARVG